MTNDENSMATSDLQDRLEYLVSYSSQLMFISSDVAKQSNILDTFIAKSTEQIEVALIAASTTTPLAKYREKLYQQLVSQTKSADFNRPLNQFLAELNHHDGPIIISVSKAENLPDKLVKELWELVLQSRFTNNKQHLNILLFAQASWARDTQKLLGGKSGDKPLLINTSTSVDSLQTELSSDLDKLIALKRKKFAERLQQRANEPQTQAVFLKRKGVIGAFILIFIALFMAILSWQYPEALQSVLNLSHDKPASLPESSETEAPANRQLTASEDLPASSDMLAEQPILSEETDKIETSLSPQSESTADPLVTDWQTAIAQVEESSTQFLYEKSSQLNREESSESIELDGPLASLPQMSDVQPSVVQSNIATQQIASPEYDMEQATLSAPLSLLSGTYYIQLLAMADKDLLLQNISEQNLTAQTWVYETQRFGGNWYVLVMQQSYASFAAAKAGLESLPTNLRAQSPFVKSANVIQQEIASNLR
ncbi:MAG: SPOR domain-containing protein [Paraglaciecola sp.]|nr:SPOR domain-containing protein [Paraglaciecola sp.]